MKMTKKWPNDPLPTFVCRHHHQEAFVLAKCYICPLPPKGMKDSVPTTCSLYLSGLSMHSEHFQSEKPYSHFISHYIKYTTHVGRYWVLFRRGCKDIRILQRKYASLSQTRPNICAIEICNNTCKYLLAIQCKNLAPLVLMHNHTPRMAHFYTV